MHALKAYGAITTRITESDIMEIYKGLSLKGSRTKAFPEMYLKVKCFQGFFENHHKREVVREPLKDRI